MGACQSSDDAFFAAINTGDVQAMRKLLDGGFSPNWHDDEDDRRGLHWAAFHGDVDMAELFIDRGADANAPSAYGTPLHLAAAKADTAVLLLLLGAKANVNVFGTSAKTSPLHIASRHGNVEAVRLLLVAKANPNAADATGETPLHAAVKGSHWEIVSLLVSRGAFVAARDADGQLPVNFVGLCDSFNFEHAIAEGQANRFRPM